MQVSELNDYLKATENRLDCPNKTKKRIMKDLKQETSDYLTEHPKATREDLLTLFGTPEEIADMIKAETSPRQTSIRIKKAVIGFLAALLVVYTVFIVISLIDVHTEAHGYFESGILCVMTLPEVSV